MARKSKHVMVNLEPLLFEALTNLTAREAASKNQRPNIGAKVRALILRELLDKQVLTQEMIQECL